MTPASFLSESLVNRLAATLGHSLWQGLTIVGLYSVVLWLSAGFRAPARYAMTLAALLALAICPIVTFATMDISTSAHGATLQATAADNGTLPADRLARPIAGRMAPSAIDSTIPAGQVIQERWQVAMEDLWARATPWIVIGWLIGVSVLGSRLLFCAFATQWLKRGAQPVPAELRACWGSIARRLGLSQMPEVLASARTGSALAIGLLQPIVLLPFAWLTDLTPAMLEAVIAHELAHIRRFDLWINLLQRILEMALFYHPAIWWLSRRLQHERELCCDELAATATGHRLVYALTLEHLARRQLAGSGPVLAAGMGVRNMTILERVRNVLGLETRPTSGRWITGLLALAVPLALWLAAPGAAQIDGTNAKSAGQDTSQPQDKAKDGKEIPWGAASEGVQCRLSADKAIWARDEMPTFKAEVRNQGKRDLSVARAQQLCEVEFDGVWYDWNGEVDLKSSSFGPNTHYKDITVSLLKSWRSKKTHKTFALTPGKHAIRIAFMPSDIRVISNKVTIEIRASGKKAADTKTYPDLHGLLLRALDGPPQANDDNELVGKEIGYYPPAKALVVKGRSRSHALLGGSPDAGKNKSVDQVGDDKEKRRQRLLRWKLVFNTKDGDDYARQLEALGAVLAVPEPGEKGEFRVLRDLKTRPVTGKIEDVGKLDRIHWVDDEEKSVAGLARALQFKPTPRFFVAMFPQKLEDELIKKEEAFAGRKGEDIKETVFKIVKTESGYEAQVSSQEKK
jgi:beta-lactamase regulating signal transducer with metallopeptidase domain